MSKHGEGYIDRLIKNNKKFIFYYDGSFKFLIDCKAKYKKDKKLTEKQWEAINECRLRK